MRDRIPFKIRFVVTAMHFLASLPVTMLITYLISAFSTTESSFGFRLVKYVNIHIPELAGVLTSIIIMALVVWNTTRQIHLFINDTGRDAINSIASSLLITLLCSLMLILTLSYIRNVGIDLIGVLLFYLSTNFSAFVAVAYFLNSIIASVYALGGFRFKSLLIFPFVKN
jgi:uncharacterized Tic20 family protein